MAETPSTMLPLGTPLPPFSLPRRGHRQDASRLADLRGTAKAALVMFICNHCPFVMHVLPELGRLARDYAAQGHRHRGDQRRTTSTRYPEDGPEHMKALAAAEGWTFPFLFDESQQVATAFHAACTPDFFLFDARRAARLPRPARRQPAEGRRAPSPAATCAPRSTRCSPGQARRRRPAPERGLQHQVEAAAARPA